MKSKNTIIPRVLSIPYNMIRLCLISIIATLCSGCGLSYMADYHAEVSRYQKSGASLPAGPWHGTWESDSNGHRGPLWCFIRPAEEHSNQYDFRYRAGWGILRFGNYTHRVSGHHQNNQFHFTGKMQLPANFGTYHVQGKITDKKFHANYQSEHGDRGTMQLQRP